MATFCFSWWTPENQICNDDGEKCWYRTKFYQFINTRSHEEEIPILMEIPFQYKLMSQLLLFRGLFPAMFDGKFIQVDSRLRCNDKSTIDVINMRMNLLSGFSLHQTSFVQRKPNFLVNIADHNPVI